jgi:hypothetical protein
MNQQRRGAGEEDMETLMKASQALNELQQRYGQDSELRDTFRFLGVDVNALRGEASALVAKAKPTLE